MLHNFIGGKWYESKSNKTDPIVNPATGEVIDEATSSDAADVDRAVEAGKGAFASWGHTTPKDRSYALLHLADKIDEHNGSLAELDSMNVGKPIGVTGDEIAMAADHLRFFAGAARTLEGRAAGEYMAGYTSIIRRDPLGVVGQITPWNYPLMMAIWKIGPALATGNTVVLKPSELTPLSSVKLAELSQGILPDGVLNVVLGQGVPVGARIVDHPDIALVSLTGDVSTGKLIAKNASQTLKRVHLELGGKAPVVVFDDADLEAAVAAIKIGGYFNAGQDCTAACRVLVQDGVYDDLVETLGEAVKTIALGDPNRPETELGPLVSAEQCERVKAMVDEAAASGGRLVCGGQAVDSPGYYFEPTVIADVRQDSQIVQREVFGPVVSVQRFSSEADAIAMANGVDYGLAASVFTNDVGRSMRMSRDLQFGTVWINDHIPLTPEMPHGGFKQSGYGKDMSIYALEAYTEVKHVMVKTGD